MPSAAAVSNLNGVGAATVTDDAPPLAINCANSSPVGPAPKISALAPGRTRSVSTPCIAQAAGSVNTAVSLANPSTENTRVCPT